MKRIAALLFFIVISAPLFSELPVGTMGNMHVSPITGDTGGFNLTIQKSKGAYSGQVVIAEGEPYPPIRLDGIACDEKSGSCRFSYRFRNATVQCVLASIPGGAILTRKDDRSLLLFKDGKEIALPGQDGFYFAEGPAYSAADKSSKVLFTLPKETVVRFVDYNTDKEYFAEIEHAGKKAFVTLEFFRASHPQAITGDDVRFRENPSADGKIIQTFRKGTIVGALYDDESGKWVRISYQGKRGYVSRDFITGY